MKNILTKNRTIQWICQIMGYRKWYIVILMLLQIMLGGCSIGLALILKRAVDEAVHGDKTGFLQMGILFVVILVIQIALSATGRFLDEYTAAILENQYKDRLFSMLLKKDYGQVTAKHSGEWMNRLTSDALVVADGLTHILPGIAGMLVKLVGALSLILLFLPQLTYILIPGGIIVVAFTYGLRKILKRLHKRVQESDGRLRVFLQENLSSMMVVRAFAREDNARKGAKEKMAVHKNCRMKKVVFSNLCNVGMAVVMNVLYLLCVGYCCFGILDGTISYGTLLAMMQLVGQVQGPVANISGYMPKYYAMLASAERLMEAENFDEQKGESYSIGKVLEFYQREMKSMGIRQGYFSYPNHPDDMVLEDITLEIKKGEFVAITGQSGCGKSTLLKLFMDLYQLRDGTRYIETEQGDVLLDSKYKRLFAYVPQGNHLMSGTIREVISFGAAEDEITDEKMEKALKISCADTFVKNLEDGINTVLGESGTGISEGQMQRLAIARAIYADCPILLLDEATSALDEETERQLLVNLRQMTEKTVIIVTHRPAALAFCDKKIQCD